MMWDMTWNLVILAGAFMALGVLLLGLGARQAARWRQGGRSAWSPDHLPRSGTDVVTAPSTRVPFRHGGVSVSGLMRWGTNRVLLVVVKQDGRGGSASWSPSIAPVRYRWWTRRRREHSWSASFELAEVDEGMPRRLCEAFVAHEGGRPIQRVSIAVLLLAWITLAMGGMAWGGAGEQRWTQYWGQIHSITVDRCGQRPGSCEGTMVLTLRHGSNVSLAIRPGMWLTRGDRLVHLEELRIGDEVHVQAFEVAGAGAEQTAQ
jgi:hypothetical protein